MFRSILTACLCAAVLLGAARVWAEDMEDRFLDPDSETSQSIFIDVKNASLVNVLKIISQQSGLSFITSQDVGDMKITLYLNKVPLNQALHMVLDANGLTYDIQKDTNIFVVHKKQEQADQLITRVYPLKYASVSKSMLNSTISLTNVNTMVSNSSATTPSGSAGGPAGASSGSDEGLEAVLKDALSKKGKVIEDVRTNSLIITDEPAQFPIIESTIAKLDVPVPQILIEVEMIDVSKSVADQLGVSYGATPISFTGAQEAVNYPLSFSRALASSSSSGSTTTTTAGAGGPFTPGSISTAGLTATLNFLTTKTDAKTLARPRILTLNNQTAEIQISTDQAIDVVPASTSTGTAGSTQTFTVDRTTTGVILKVTPQANLLTREVTMAVSPRDIDLLQSNLVSPTNQPIYDPETRGSDSILKLRDGQSMVIGGLVTNEKTNTVTKLPFLGDLPLVGAAFRSKNASTKERELLIFLTPHILDDARQQPLSPEDQSDTQDASRVQEINNSLNNIEMQQ